MKVALTHPYSWPEVRRGAERIVAETARSLVARGHQVTVLTAGSTASTHAEGGVNTIRLQRRYQNALRHERWFGRRIVPHLRRGAFDVVHSMMPYDALAALRTKRKAGHRTVYEELGIPYRWYWRQIPDGRARRRLVQRIDHYGCVSNFCLDVLRDEWGRQGDLIPCGVRMSEFLPRPREAAPTILFSGALDAPEKGLGDLLQAASLLVDIHPELRIWLSGPGDPAGQLAGLAAGTRERVQVLELGAPEAQGDRYARAWVTALPSVGDSFGMVLVESLAAGTPIVVSDHSAPPQLVTDQTGVVAPLHDIAALADAITTGFTLAQNPDTSQRCRDFARQFDWDEAIAPLLEKLYGAA